MMLFGEELSSKFGTTEVWQRTTFVPFESEQSDKGSRQGGHAGDSLIESEQNLTRQLSGQFHTYLSQFAFVVSERDWCVYHVY